MPSSCESSNVPSPSDLVTKSGLVQKDAPLVERRGRRGVGSIPRLFPRCLLSAIRTQGIGAEELGASGRGEYQSFLDEAC
jgi:hypothetical protein